MDTRELDNPAWAALCGRHAHLRLGDGEVLRYPADVSPFAALRTPDALPELGRRMTEGDTAVLWSPEALEAPQGVDLVVRFDCLQMEGFDFRPFAGDEGEDVLVLDETDVAEMIDLTALTRPGPFHARTRHMGHYIGIRIDGRLAAMAGERMKPQAFTEVSAICTHPEFQCRGLARRLTSLMARRVVADGRVPFLNVLPDNHAAIALYEALGFKTRCLLQVHLLRKPGGDAQEDAFFSRL